MFLALMCFSVALIVIIAVSAIAFKATKSAIDRANENKALPTKKEDAFRYQDIRGPDDFFEYVKYCLPKDKGLIYSMRSEIYSGQNTSANRVGDHAVRVTVMDPINDKILGKFNMNQGREWRFDHYATVKRDVIESVNDIIKKWDLEKFAGHEEIVS